LDVLADFPAIPAGWAYLDTAATSQKPQPVIDAITRGYAETYATVHRGVYQRSADMTLAYEAARRRVAEFIGGQEREIVFVRGATEAINLVAASWAGTQLKAGDRILLSTLEHHSNIVPWQMIAEKIGAHIDVVPLTVDHRIDLDAMAAMLTPQHKLVALAHVSNVLGSVLDARRAAALAHSVGAKILIDGCQAVPRMPVDVAHLDCDFYVFSGHKLYGPTGIGVLWGRYELLDAMPPYQGGGSMIDRVSFAGTTYAPPPGRFEAGTPHIVGVVGLHAAIDYVQSIGLGRIERHETALVRQAREALSRLNSVRLFGPDDVATILDEGNVAIRAGHHCAQPLMDALGVPATARASFGVYNNASDIDGLITGIQRVTRIFG
jgi:cysteine desulfurase/selenocysteine lyase